MQRIKCEIAASEATIEQRINWFSERYGYSSRPGHVSYAGVVSTIEHELDLQASGLSALFNRAKAAKLREFLAEFRNLVETLHEKTAELRKCEHMLREE